MTVLDRFFSNNEMLLESPKPCSFKVGDVVTFTNEYGVSFSNLIVIGFAKPENEVNGGFVHISTECAWFPVKPETLTVQGQGSKKKFTVVYPNGETLDFEENHG